MKSLLIVNPVAGQGRPKETLGAVEDAFRSTVRKLVVTSARGDAEAAAREASSSVDIDEVIVAGGDGTVNEVVNGLMQTRPADGPTKPLGIIPLGTQNVLAKELGIDGDIESCAAMIQRGRKIAIDVGDANGRFFALMAGFGFDAAVVNEMIAPIKGLIGPAAYAFAAAGTLAKYHSTKVRLELDDEPVQSDAFLVIVANASSYGFRQIKVAPFAALDDGWLDVCVFERAPFDRVGFATQMMAAIAGRHLRDPRVRYYRARRVKIDSDPPIDGQVDGDMFQQTPVTINLIPTALTVYVPG